MEKSKVLIEYANQGDNHIKLQEIVKEEEQKCMTVIFKFKFRFTEEVYIQRTCKENKAY